MGPQELKEVTALDKFRNSFNDNIRHHERRIALARLADRLLDGMADEVGFSLHLSNLFDIQSGTITFDMEDHRPSCAALMARLAKLSEEGVLPIEGKVNIVRERGCTIVLPRKQPNVTTDEVIEAAPWIFECINSGNGVCYQTDLKFWVGDPTMPGMILAIRICIGNTPAIFRKAIADPKDLIYYTDDPTRIVERDNVCRPNGVWNVMNFSRGDNRPRMFCVFTPLRNEAQAWMDVMHSLIPAKIN